MKRKDVNFKLDILNFYFRTHDIEETLNKFGITYTALYNLVLKYDKHGAEGLKTIYDRYPPSVRLSAIIDKYANFLSDKELLKKYNIPNMSYIYSWKSQYNNSHKINSIIDSFQEKISTMAIDLTKNVVPQLQSRILRSNKEGYFELDKLSVTDVRQRILAANENFKSKYDVIQYYLEHGYDATFEMIKNGNNSKVSQSNLKSLIAKYEREGYSGLFDRRYEIERELRALWNNPLEEWTPFDVDIMRLFERLTVDMLKKHTSLNHLTKK